MIECTYNEFIIKCFDLNKDNLALISDYSDKACFFVIEQLEDADFVETEAMRVIDRKGNRKYHFYGAKEPVWHRIFDETDTDINGDLDIAAETIGYEDVDSFVEAIKACNCNSYLFYDDVVTLAKVVERIK